MVTVMRVESPRKYVCTITIRICDDSRLQYNSIFTPNINVTDDDIVQWSTQTQLTCNQPTGARRRDHITPILRQLHWLPVRQRVTFKIAVLVFQCLTGQAPAYLADDCHLRRQHAPTQINRHSDVRRPRSNNSFVDFTTGVLRLLDHVCGTCCRFIYGCVTVSDSINGCSRPICLVFETAALCDA